MTNKILSSKEAREKTGFFWKFHNGDYAYKLEGGYWSLIRDGEDLLKGLKAVDYSSCDMGNYEYKLEDGKVAIICINKKVKIKENEMTKTQEYKNKIDKELAKFIKPMREDIYKLKDPKDLENLKALKKALHRFLYEII